MRSISLFADMFIVRNFFLAIAFALTTIVITITIAEYDCDG